MSVHEPLEPLVHAEAEWMPGRVEENPESGTGLRVRFGGTQLDGDLFPFVQVLHHQVQVHLLWYRLARPFWCPVAVHLLKRNAVTSVVGSDFGPVSVDLHIPAEQGTVKGREGSGVRAVDDETWEACDSHTGMLPSARRKR